MSLVASGWQWLEVPGGHNVVGKGAPHAHALLLVDQQAVLLHLDVRLQLLLPPNHVIKLNNVGAGCILHGGEQVDFLRERGGAGLYESFTLFA